VFNLFWRPFVPGFRVRPHDGVPGFNIDQNGLPRSAGAWSDAMLPDTVTQRYSDTGQVEMPYGISLPTAGPERLVQSPPTIGLAGFRASAPDNVPGFNFRPPDGVPGLDLDDGVEEQETDTPSPTPPPDTEEAVQPALPQFPNWTYDLLAMLPQVSAESGPFPGRHVAVNSPLNLPSTEPLVPGQWPSSEVRPRFGDMSIGSRDATRQSIGPQSLDQSAMSTAWPQPPNNRWPYSQPAMLRNPWSGSSADQPIRLPPIVEPRPNEGSNFIPTSSPVAGGHQVQRQALLQQNQQTQPSSSLGTVTPDGDGPSLGQRLAQSSVDTIVPGAYYQKLAREQLGAGNYVGAGVYQGAAFLDAALGAATLGLSTRLGAGIRTAAGEGAALFRRAFDSHSQLWRYLGRAPEGMQWHHIVEQSQMAQFGQRIIQSVENIVAIPIEAHQKLNAFYSSKQYFSEPKTVREWLRGQSFETQYEFGMTQLKRLLGY